MKTDGGSRYQQFGLSLLALMAFASSPGHPQDVPPCQDAKVQYSSVDDKYMEKIRLQAVTELQVPDGVEKQFSPQRTFWLYPIQPNYQKDGPWATTVLIKSADGNTMRKLTLLDHGTGGVKLAWLNERLLFVQVWWGRILSTDFILDVQNREFLYEQNAYYGQLMESCK